MILTAIKNLKLLQPLNIANADKWLKEYKSLYDESVKTNEYSSIYFYHCQKDRKSENHLFQDIYSRLKKHLKYLKKNLNREKRIKIELEKYELCKNNSLELKEWLKNNLKDGLKVYLIFDYNNKTKVFEELNFTLCKISNENYRIIMNNESSFESLHLFSKIFIDLFFEKIILPIEYEIWKKEVGYDD
jgi:hypothetical protein